MAKAQNERGPAPGERRSQGDRSAATRQRILDATITCLVERGYAGTTTSVIQDQAGVSRGAITHQFPTRDSLMVAAVSYLSKERAQRISDRLRELPTGPQRVREGLRLTWAEYSGELFAAVLELWTASRTDDGLQEALIEAERELGETQRELIAGSTEPQSLSTEEMDLAARIMRGTALTDMVRRKRSDPEKVVEQCLRALGRD